MRLTAPVIAPDVTELLTCLIEECAEITKATTKALRFGLDHQWESEDDTNIRCVAHEIGDLLAVVDRLVAHRAIDVTRDAIDDARRAKQKRLATFLLRPDNTVDVGGT
ncbi:MAG: hypothetical protein ACYDHD_03540 [Vulcanimicrobiaceae bacterium]